jgi:hypothetical protein
MLSGKKLEEIRESFCGKSMIKSIISGLSSFKHFLLPDKFETKTLDFTYSDPQNKTSAIDILISDSSHLSVHLYRQIIESHYNIESICGIIAIENSQTLSPENKLVCITFAISMANAFVMGKFLIMLLFLLIINFNL